jgi:lysylphosphatidylglycerol synthetase-like protein (DUF2156 family)
LFATIPRRNERCNAATSRFFVACALLCLGLVLLISFAQIAHVHPNAADQDHCPLCIVLHSAVPIAAAAAVLILMQIAEKAPVLEPRTISLLWHVQLFTRPPPSLR